jgi:hypothetical protein
MIDPTFAAHRARLAQDMDFWRREHEVYRKQRREGIVNYVGSTDLAKVLGIKKNKPMLGNLYQLAGIAHAVTLAYNTPRYLCVPTKPSVEAIAIRGKEWLNQYSPLIGLGAVARGCATDSYFGYGIIRVGIGQLPAGVRRMTGQQLGPMCRRVSQDHFIWDGNATEWPDVTWMADEFLAPLDQAKNFPLFNPEVRANLAEYTRQTSQQGSDGRVHQTQASGMRAVGVTQLVRVYFPQSEVEAIWPANDGAFKAVNGEPLWVGKYEGHHSGPYAILSHLDIPDNLIPVPLSESTKGLHFLFNELATITSEQAKKARYNPTYEQGGQRDIELWEKTPDRKPIPVSNVQRLGSLQIPGPDQSQTAYMNAVYQMFNEFSGNPRDTLGLGATAPTARQSELIRSATTVRGGEARRRMNEVMELVGRKLLHLALNDETHRFPMRMQLPRTKLSMDISWLTPNEMPRTKDVDDFTVKVIPESMEFRTAQQRLAALKEATAEIVAIAQAVAQGAPIDLEAVVETQAEYRDLPELREWWAGVLPEYQQAKAAGQGMSFPDSNKGVYERHNISQRTGEGAITQSLTQFGDSMPEAA